MITRLVLPGPPMARYEAHHAASRGERSATFPDKRTTLGINAWRLRWQEAGCPYYDGPITLGIRITVRRPKGHYRTDGRTLNSTGERAPVPTRVDVDNVTKLILDALKRHAFADDRKVATLDVRKRWARDERDAEQTVVTITNWHPEPLDLPLVLHDPEKPSYTAEEMRRRTLAALEAQEAPR